MDIVWGYCRSMGEKSKIRGSSLSFFVWGGKCPPNAAIADKGTSPLSAIRRAPLCLLHPSPRPFFSAFPSPHRQTHPVLFNTPKIHQNGSKWNTCLAQTRNTFPPKIPGIAPRTQAVQASSRREKPFGLSRGVGKFVPHIQKISNAGPFFEECPILAVKRRDARCSCGSGVSVMAQGASNMASSFNKTIIIGRLGRDPEVRQGEKTEFANFSLCHSSTRDGKEVVQWHNIVAFGKQAQICSKYLRKGDLCCVEGHIDARSYEKNGERRTAHSIVLERVTFLSPQRRHEAVKESRLTANDFEEAFPY